MVLPQNIQRRIDTLCTIGPVLTAALCSVARYAVSLDAPIWWIDSERGLYIHNLFSYVTEWNYVLFRKWIDLKITILNKIRHSPKDQLSFSQKEELDWHVWHENRGGTMCEEEKN